MNIKKVLRKIEHFFSRLYWRNRLGELGSHTRIDRKSVWHNPRAMALGSKVLIRTGCQLSVRRMRKHGAAVRLRIDDQSSLQQGCKIAAAQSISIGRQVMIADNVFITDHDHIYDDPHVPAALIRELRSAPVVIEDGCWLGYGAVVLKGVRIGKRSVIGANSVVTRDVPPFTVVAGNPARVIKKIDLAAAGD
ncbi:MAG: hypothetical protein C0613_02505 [Desulfobulbaceae bacterium]|nr:MAG: hypothetical protein C0613_02505 [Desulfobulbaceae bacterium]